MAVAQTAMAEASRELYETVKKFKPISGDFDGWRKASYEVQEVEFKFRTKKVDYEVLLAQYLSQNPIPPEQ